jgi:hypothetical protein
MIENLLPVERPSAALKASLFSKDEFLRTSVELAGKGLCAVVRYFSSMRKSS